MLEPAGVLGQLVAASRARANEHSLACRQSVKQFTASLAIRPDDMRVRWLLNVASRRQGGYPENVPQAYRISFDWFDSDLKVGRFDDVARQAGLGAGGPSRAGSSVFDDFTGDGLPDIFVASLDTDRGATLYVNRGNGTFEVWP